MQRPLLRRTLTLRFIALLPLALVTGTSSETLQRARHVRFTTHEGSWLSFDVSRDARWIVMDLLGQLWLLPAAGGVASAITDVVRDTAEFVDPSYAPDGASIMVHGEFRGLPGTYRVNVRNGVAERLTPDARRGGTGIGLNSGSWSPDGRAIVLTRRDSLIERELATGAERRIVATGLPAGELDSPTYSPDGRDIYFNSIVRTIPSFPPSGRIWRIPAVGGAAQPVSPAGLNALAAAPSPDGRRITYLVMDSASRAQVWMQGVLDSTAVQLTNDRDVTATRVRWIAGSDALVYAESGRLWRLDIATRGRREIPFSATVNFVRHEPKLAPVRFPSAGEEVAARGHAGFALSADGR